MRRRFHRRPSASACGASTENPYFMPDRVYNSGVPCVLLFPELHKILIFTCTCSTPRGAVCYRCFSVVRGGRVARIRAPPPDPDRDQTSRMLSGSARLSSRIARTFLSAVVSWSSWRRRRYRVATKRRRRQTRAGVPLLPIRSRMFAVVRIGNPTVYYLSRAPALGRAGGGDHVSVTSPDKKKERLSRSHAEPFCLIVTVPTKPPTIIGGRCGNETV